MNQQELDQYIAALEVSIPSDAQIDYLKKYQNEIISDPEYIDYIKKTLLIKSSEALALLIKKRIKDRKIQQLAIFTLSDLVNNEFQIEGNQQHLEYIDGIQKRLISKEHEYIIKADREAGLLQIVQKIQEKSPILVSLNGQQIHGRIIADDWYKGYRFENIDLNAQLTLSTAQLAEPLVKQAIAKLKTSLLNGLDILEGAIHQELPGQFSYSRGEDDEQSLNVEIDGKHININYNHEKRNIDIVQYKDEGFDFDIEVNGVMLTEQETRKKEYKYYYDYLINDVDENSEIKIYKKE